jgi:hypothetical protein
MKIENISRSPVPSDLSAKCPGTASDRGDAFESVLELERTAFAEEVSLPKDLSIPPQSVVAVPTPSGTPNMTQTLALYERGISPSPFPQSETELSTREVGPSGTSQGGSVTETESTVSFSSVIKGIKNFLVGLFTPNESSSVKPDVAAGTGVGEGTEKSAIRFLSRLAEVLTLGLWRPHGSGEQAKASEVPGANISHTEDASTERKDSSLQAVNGVGNSAGLSASAARGKSGALKSKRTAGGEVQQISAEIQKAITEAAKKHDLPAELIAAVIKVESNFNPHAVSKEGAKGLMQLMPSTARTLSVRNAFDVRQNIDGGCRYLKTLLDRFNGDVDLALAAYSTGPAAVEKFKGIPPYRQTQHYIAKVRRYC